jgi:TolA-binding protein
MTAINVPEEIRKFAPKKVRRGAPMDQSGDDLINMLQKTTFQLQTAEDRISAVETAIKQWQDRAAQVETQLFQLIQDQIKRRAG